MNYPQAYIEYLIYFHGPRDYFECHEVLEEHWKEGNSQDPVWIGLIQVAVSLYHYRRGNLVGSKRMMETAINNIRKFPVTSLDLDQEVLLQQMNDIIRGCDLELPYKDLDLPIISDDLLKECKQKSEQRGFSWGTPSNINDPNLIHKHKLRDRSDVILERKKQLKQRKTK